MIRVCNCLNKNCHAYCATANVLRTQKIFCRDCQSYYRLHAQGEKLFKSEYISVNLYLLLFYAVFVAMIYGIKVLDSYLKKNAAREGDPEIVDMK